MWSRLTRGGDGLPREKVDAIVRLIDQYLSEEASLRNLQSDKQTIHPRDLPPDKREALIEEIFEILKDTKRRSEEHTSELQSRQYLVCRLLLEKRIRGKGSE